jgi:hypothetical protein
MTKIVYNACFGGFGLSNAAVRRWAELKGDTVYDYVDPRYRDLPDEERREYHGRLIRCTPEEFDNASASVRNEMHISEYNIKRDDPDLVRVVEELGSKKAGGRFSKLVIEELEPGTRYRISEYDGYESIETDDSVDWSVA